MSRTKRVVVLGGSSGIGEATALRFADEGWQVAAAAPDLSAVKSVCGRLSGSGHLAGLLDVTQENDIRGFEQLLSRRWKGSFDVLVNSVGVSTPVPVLDPDFDRWETPLKVMLTGSVQTIRRLVTMITDGGRIINITSIHHERVAPGNSAYGMAKAAITQFTRALAIELAPRGILANCIAPGFVRTPMSIKEDGKSELDSEWFQDNYIRYGHLPLKRAAEPEEIAGVAWFLAGPDATYITGAVLTVDGGLTITF